MPIAETNTGRHPGRMPLPVLVVLLAGALAAMVVSGWVMRHGVGFEADSMAYVSAARTLVGQGQLLIPDGAGNLMPLAHWPPLYPVLLAGLNPVAGDALAAARDLNLILFPLNILLLAALVWRATRSPMATVVVAAIFILSPNILDIHVTAMSEAPALACWLAGMLLLLEYQRSAAWPLLLGAALAAGACLLLRYVGVVLVISGAGFILCCAPTTRKRRWLGAVFYAVTAILPLAVWIVSRHGSGVTTERHLGVYGLGSEQLSAAAIAWVRWLAPLDGHLPLKLILAAVMAAGLVALVIGWSGAKPSGQPAVGFSPAMLFATNLLLYELLLVFCGLFLDPRQDIGERMQTMAFVFLLLGATVLMAGPLRGRWCTAGKARILAAGLLVLLLGVRLMAAVAWVRSADNHSLGYNNADWRGSAACDLVKKSFADVPVYANYIVPLYLQTGRADLRRIPEAMDDLRHQADPEFDRRMTTLVEALAKNHGVLVLFNSKSPRYLTAEQMTLNPRLQIIRTTPDATLFQAKAE